jgi:hypothetical protein
LPETAAVLACAQWVVDESRLGWFKAALDRCPSPERLCVVAAKHHMLGQLDRAVRALGSDVDPDLAAYVAARQLQTAAHGLRQVGLLLAMLADLERHGIQAMPIKGPAWAQRLYGDVALRNWGDLDLVVRHEHKQLAREILLTHGLVDDSPHNERILGEPSRTEGAVHLSTRDGSVHVDLHWRVSAGGATQGAVGGETLLETSRPFMLLDAEVPGPPDGMLVLLLLMHGARHRWATVEESLAVALAARRLAPGGWPAVVAAADAVGCRRRLTVGLTHASHILGVRLPSAVSSLPVDPLSGILLRTLTPATLEPPSHRGLVDRLETMAWRAGSEDSALAALRYAVARVFVPGPEDWDASASTGRSEVGSYVNRPVRLVAKWVGRMVRNGKTTP